MAQSRKRKTSKPRPQGAGGQHQGAPQQPRTVPPQRSRSADSAAAEPKTSVDEVMEKAEWPGRLLTYGGVAFVVLISIFWPKYFLNPAATRHLRGEADFGVCAVLFLTASTLTLLMYSLLVAQNSATNKRLISVILNRAGIGATLGTFVGIRLARELLIVKSGASAAFPEYISDMGNVITYTTLIFIAGAWPFAFGAFRAAVQGAKINGKELPPWAQKTKPSLTLLVVLGVNLGASSLAWFTFLSLIRK